MIEARALQLFITLADRLHFGRSADALGISQSVLSTQILRIEDRIGTRLFNRGRRAAVSLTPAGYTFLVEARLAIEQLNRVELIGRLAGKGEAGPVKIGFVFSAVLTGCLRKGLEGIRRELPFLDVQPEPMETPEQIAAIADGRIDVGFIRPRSAYPESVEARTIHSEGLVIALSRDHPLANTSPLLPESLAGERFIFPQFSSGDGFGETIDRLATLGGFSPQPSIRTRDFVTAIAMASAGYGVALAPRSMDHFALDGVMVREVQGLDEKVDLALAWRSGSNLRLVNELLAAFSD